jgi:hypothetical protein
LGELYDLSVDILQLITPDIWTSIAYLIGANIIGAMIVTGVLYVCRFFGWLF